MQIKRDLTLCAASILLVGSFFLPNAVAGITDSNRLNNMIMIDSQRISFDSVPELGIPERLALIANWDTEIMPLNFGNVMDEETAGSRAVRELSRFLRGGPFSFELRTCKVEECSAAFVIDMMNPNVNMIIWELSIADALENTAIVTIDDETGMILKIIYKQAARNQNPTAANNSSQPGLSDEELYSNALRLSEMINEYYGLQIILGDYYYNGSISYYRADLSDGGRVIPMFGVVRSTSFTMNEKVKSQSS